MKSYFTMSLSLFPVPHLDRAPFTMGKGRVFISNSDTRADGGIWMICCVIFTVHQEGRGVSLLPPIGFSPRYSAII